jgi:U3 small nucleolar RNA-associated protein 13
MYLVLILTLRLSFFIFSPRYNTTSQQLVSITSDQNILFFDVENDLKRVKQIVGYNDEIIDVAYIGEEETHLAVAANSEQIRVFNLKEFECDLIYGHTDIVICLDRNADGTLLASGSKDNTAKVWTLDLENEDADERYKCIGSCVGHTEAIGAVALTKKTDGLLLTGSQDRTIKCWDLSTAGMHSTFFVDTRLLVVFQYVLDVTLTPPFRFLLTLADLDEPDENLRFKSHYTIQAHEKDINTIDIAPNDKIFATGSQDKLAKIWNLQEGTLIGTCKGHKRGVWSVKFSPVDQCLATSSGDRTIKIWSLNDFSCLRTFEGHTNSILKVDFMTSGLQLVSCGSDGLVKLWTIRTNECVTTLDNHTEKIWALAVRKDENMVVTGGADSMINMWEDFTEIEYAEKKAAKADQVLKEQELSNYLQRKDWKNAITLALSLEQPFRLLQLFNQILQDRPEHDTSVTGLEAVDKVLLGLSPDQTAKLLGYVRDWNTHAKNMRAAQTVLNAILRQRKVQEMIEIPGIKDLLDGLLPYSDRHFQRVEALTVRSYVVDYTVQAMDLMSLVGGMDDMDMDDEETEEGESKGLRAQRKAEEELMAKERHEALAAARASTAHTSTAQEPTAVVADGAENEDAEEGEGDDSEDSEDDDDEDENEDDENEEESDEDME